MAGRTGKAMMRLLAIVVVLAVAAGSSMPASADAKSDCFGEDLAARVVGCTALIERGDPGEEERSYAYAMRGLAFSIQGHYEAAIRDYDAAIVLKPDFAVALNNRAWAYFRWGKAESGLPDVEKALLLNPASTHTLDTRAHIRQALGDPVGALSDYEKAIWYGGVRMINLYQCGLKGLSLYSGEIDGILRPELTEALRKCAHDKACDPLPPGEKCP
jgi:tetratricopeptide (TPR) repeat protein